MISSSATLKQAAAQLADVRRPALAEMGRDDSDFPDPGAEAAAIVGLLPDGRQVQDDRERGPLPPLTILAAIADAVLPFLAENTHA